MSRPLRVLITNFELDIPSGTTTYVRDLALELRRQGHQPVVYTFGFGAIARELADAGILVTRRLYRIRQAPDVIHGHHWLPTLRALSHFRTVPAIYICHDHTSFLDRAVIHPQIRRYFGVSQLCLDRLIADGVAAHAPQLLLNFVDTQRFVARTALPARARRALVFSNYARANTHLPAISEACRQAGLELDVIGHSVGNSLARPESALGRYDIVFAKAKAAMEAIATGAAVVLCDFGGVGPLVASANFDHLRPLNFGFQALREPLTPECLLRQIERYDPEDAARVCAKLRSSAGLEEAVRQLHEFYIEAIRGERLLPGAQLARSPQPIVVRVLEAARSMLFVLWVMSPAHARTVLRRIRGLLRALPTKLGDKRFTRARRALRGQSSRAWRE